MTKLAKTGTIAAALLAAGLTASSASAADAATHQQSVSTTTSLAAHPDSGAAGNTWADDGLTRDFTLTLVGQSGGLYHFQGKISDRGGFEAIAGQLTPNQSGPYAGDKLASNITGQMSGSATFDFYTNRSWNLNKVNLGIPYQVNGAIPANKPQETTTYWYEQAFPAGTQFSGLGLTNFSYNYVAAAYSPFRGFGYQTWTDSQSNGDGDLPGDGNILG